MKKLTLGSILTVSLLGLLLAAGCAKKPIAAEATPAAADPPPAAQMSAPVQASPVVQPVNDPTPAPKAEIPTVELERIHFAFDQFSLSPDARDALTANAVVFKTNPELTVTIEGHCDDRGSDEYNLALGERRAQAAKEYLVSLGVPTERLQVISYGEEQPLDPVSSKAAWAKNRRADFKKTD